jgi:hypothetical protein
MFRRRFWVLLGLLAALSLSACSRTPTTQTDQERLRREGERLKQQGERERNNR